MGSISSKPYNKFTYRYHISHKWRQELHDDLCNYIMETLFDNNIIMDNNRVFNMIANYIIYFNWFIFRSDNTEKHVFMIKSLFYIRFMHFMKHNHIYNDYNEKIIRSITEALNSICTF